MAYTTITNKVLDQVLGYQGVNAILDNLKALAAVRLRTDLGGSRTVGVQGTGAIDAVNYRDVEFDATLFGTLTVQARLDPDLERRHEHHRQDPERHRQHRQGDRLGADLDGVRRADPDDVLADRRHEELTGCRRPRRTTRTVSSSWERLKRMRDHSLVKFLAGVVLVGLMVGALSGQDQVLHGGVTVKLGGPVAICQNATAITDWSTPAANPGVAACLTGTNTQQGTLDFADGGTALSVQRAIVLPADLSTIAAIDVRLKWLTTATTGNVVWQVATICVADAETSDPAFNAASTVTDAAKGTTLQTNDAAITGLTVTGCRRRARTEAHTDPAHASDTLAATAQLLGFERRCVDSYEAHLSSCS
jgi:hypothetical protein